MVVYGRIEKVSEAIDENKVVRDVKSHLENEQEMSIPFLELIIGSIMATIFSSVLPLLLDMVSSSQAQDLYIGWALHKVGDLYSNYYASRGFLYYLLLYITKGSVLFALVEWFAFLGSGYFLYRSTSHLTGASEQAKQLLIIFYILVSGLGFGGGYASILAMPFLFAGFYLIANYLSHPNHDKGFLSLGILFGISFFIDSLTSSLFIIAITIGLIIFNIKNGRFLNGVYQFFASALGFSLAFYPLAYLVLISGGVEKALSSMLYPIDSIRIFTNSQLLDNTLFYGLITLGLGGFLLIFLGFTQSKVGKLHAISIPACFVFLLSLFLIVFSQEPLEASRLIVSLPFLVLLLIATIQVKDSGKRVGSRRREGIPSLWKKFMKGSLYLPILVVAYLISFPFVNRFILHADSYNEQHRVVDRIRQDTGEEDQIYIWDQNVQVYKESQRLAGSIFPSPVLYTTTTENKNILINDLKENQPKMIIVNDKVSLWSEVEALLKENYQVEKTDLPNFKVYKLK